MTKAIYLDARRRWSDEDKQRIIEESLTNPVSRIAKKYGVATSLLFRWRKEQGIGGRTRPAASAVRLVPALVAPEAPDRSTRAVTDRRSGRIEIVVTSGRRVIVDGDVDAAALARVLAVLERP